VSDVACSALRITTQIATPDPVGITTVVVGDMLSVQVISTHGQQVVAVYKAAQLVGGLAGNNIGRLRDCILAGTVYHAKVVSAAGPRVMVDIEP
jgi:hypothetical protein